MEINKGHCPICGQENDCAYQKGRIHEGCWCETIQVPKELRMRIPEHLKGKACICRNSVKEFNETLKREKE